MQRAGDSQAARLIVVRTNRDRWKGRQTVGQADIKADSKQKNL